MKTIYTSSTNPGDQMTAPHCVVLRYDEHKKEFVTHILNLQTKGYDYGNYFMEEGDSTVTWNKAVADYKARCVKYGVTPRIIDRMEVEGTFTHFVVRGEFVWGKGKSMAEAISKLKVGKLALRKMQLRAFWGTEDIEVFSDGSVSAQQMVDLGLIQEHTK